MLPPLVLQPDQTMTEQIIPLGNSSVFFELGNSKFTNFGKIVIDPDQIARETYHAVSAGNSKWELKDVAEKWASSMDVADSRLYALVGENLLKRAAYKGAFNLAGFAGPESGSNPSVSLYMVVTSFSTESDVNRRAPAPSTPDLPPQNYWGFSHGLLA
jgi:hypothetical protein